MLRLLLVSALACAPGHAAAQALLPSQAPPAQAPAAPTEAEQKIMATTSVAQLERLAGEAAARKDWKILAATFRRLAELRPFNPAYRYSLAAAYAEQDMKRETYDILAKMQASGHSFELEKDERFAKVRNTEVWRYIVENMKANAGEFGDGKVAYTLPAADTLVEAIAWDPNAKTLLAGSAREGRVYRVDAKGGLVDYVKADATNGLWAVMDVAVDAPRNVLWVASAAIPHYKYAQKTDYGRAGVFKFALDSGKFLAKYEVPVDGRQHLLSSIAVAPSGAVFAADGVNRALYKVEGDKLRFIISNPALTGIRGMAATDKALYFADFELGLFGFDLASGEPFSVAGPENVNLYGIDGLAAWKGQLVAIQAGFPPKRIMRFELSPDGRAIVKQQALEASRKDWGTPTRGTIAGDTLYYIGNTQKAKYDAYGVPRSDAKLDGVKIHAVDVSLGIGAPAGVKPKQPATNEKKGD